MGTVNMFLTPIMPHGHPSDTAPMSRSPILSHKTCVDKFTYALNGSGILVLFMVLLLHFYYNI